VRLDGADLKRSNELKEAFNMAVTQTLTVRNSTEKAGTSWRERWPTVVSVALVAAVTPAIAYGLFADEAYRGYGNDVVLTSRAQDLLTALVLPALVWAGARSRRGSLRAHILWLGLLFYLLYSYALYLIGWEQNRCFLLYVAIVTLSGAALVDGLLRVEVHAVQPLLRSHHLKAMGIFLVTIGVAFTGLWLTDVLPMVFGGRQPQHLGPGGTPYAVYVLDLALALPTVVATGILLIRDHPASGVLGGMVLVKISTLFTALWLGVLVQSIAGSGTSFTPDMIPGGALLIFSIAVVRRGAQLLRNPPMPWIRSALWPESRHDPAGGSSGTRHSTVVP
jgi:hypothetical protein